jgi:glycosyltransferase involved in cell wall biosynthesis
MDQVPDSDHANSSRSPQSDIHGSHAERRLRILAFGDIYPWPPQDGYHLRFASLLNALSEVGDLDLFVAVLESEEVMAQAPTAIGRCEVVVAKSMSPSTTLALRTLRSRLPTQILWHEWDDARSRLDRFARGPYDLVWYMHADTFVAFGDPTLGPAVVDFDNLMNNLLRRPMSSLMMFSAPTRGRLRLPRVKVGDIARWALHLRDRLLWYRLQREIARRASAVVLCSEVDRKRLGSPRAVVVPNGYRDPGPPTDPLPEAPILVMVGLFTYQPNIDGAVWMANYVLPELRRAVPGVVVRFIGHYDHRLESIASVPGVQIVGKVPQVGSELRGARGAVVPLLHGSGTRIKILEALAYALPVVTTAVGCEGLGLTTEVEALVRNDPLEFAAACALILTDDALCERLRSGGRSLFLDRFDAKKTATLIGQLASNVASTTVGAANGPPSRLQSSLYGSGRPRRL